MSWIVKAAYPNDNDHDWVYFKSYYGNGSGANYRQYKCKKCLARTNIWPLSMRLYFTPLDDESKKLLSCLYRQMKMACE